MKKFLASIVLSSALISSAVAQSSENQQFQTIIKGQLEAFKSDNGAEAYSYASPLVQRIFPNAEVFMTMVQNGYPPVYHNSGYQFGALSHDALGRPVQEVTITGLDGERYVAAYALEQEADGSWKIAGCTLLKIQGLGV